jgi:hypothetical protein
MARYRRRYRRNPNDVELILGVVLGGAVVWGLYEAYQAAQQAAADVSSGIQSAEQSVSNAIDTVNPISWGQKAATWIENLFTGTGIY